MKNIIISKKCNFCGTLHVEVPIRAKPQFYKEVIHGYFFKCKNPKCNLPIYLIVKRLEY